MNLRLPAQSLWLLVSIMVTACLLPLTEAKPDEPENAVPPTADLMLGEKAGQERNDNSLQMNLVWCPPGKFTMGSPKSKVRHFHNEDQVEVTLTRGFWLGKYEVTQSEWMQVTVTEPWKGKAATKEGDDFPVTNVSWHDAIVFCRQLTDRERKAGRLPEGWEYTLPTEAQWERACRAQTETTFSFADESKLGEYAWFNDNAVLKGEAYAHRVGQKKSNPWGLFDMHGNVWEWCWDADSNALPGGRDPVTETGGSSRVFRGGCWAYAAAGCRSAYRGWSAPSRRDNGLGFRVAVDTVQPFRAVMPAFDEPKTAPRLTLTGMFNSVRQAPWQIAEQGGMQGHFWGAAFSPDGKSYMIFGDSGPRGGIRLWDLATGEQLQEFQTGKNVWFANARFLPDGRHVVAAFTNDKNIYLWDVATGKIVHEFQGHTVDGVAVFVSHDGRLLVSSGKDNGLRLWDVSKRQQVWTQDVSGEQITGVVFTPDDNLILTSGADGTLRIREAKTGAVAGKLEGHLAPCAGDFSPDGKQVLSWADDGQVRVWDVGTSRTLHQFEGRRDAARKAWHLEGGRQVLTWGKDLVFRVWDAKTGAKLREIAIADMLPPGWSEAVVSPDGRRLLVVNSDGDDVRLVDLGSGERLYRSGSGQLPKARGFAFSADGRFVAAGSFRTGVYLIELPIPSADGGRVPAGDSPADKLRQQK